MLLALLSCFGLARGAGAQGRAATTARPRDSAAWRERVLQINRDPQRLRAQVLLLGDSIVYGWRFAGRGVLRRSFPRLRTFNMGMDSDETGHLLWRLAHGHLSGVHPRLVLLMVGINNVNQPGQRPSEVASGIEAVIAALQSQLPRCHILLHAILPSGRPGSQLRAKIAATNALLPAIARRRPLVYLLNIGPHLLSESGRMLPGVTHDGLHLTRQGYRIWAAQLRPWLRRLERPEHEPVTGAASAAGR